MDTARVQLNLCSLIPSELSGKVKCLSHIQVRWDRSSFGFITSRR